MIQEANLICIKVLNILASKLVTIQNFFHSCHPLSKTFCPSNGLLQYKSNFFHANFWKSSIDFMLLIAYWTFLLTWHAQNMTLQMGMLDERKNQKQQKSIQKSKCLD